MKTSPDFNQNSKVDFYLAGGSSITRLGMNNVVKSVFPNSTIHDADDYNSISQVASSHLAVVIRIATERGQMPMCFHAGLDLPMVTIIPHNQYSYAVEILRDGFTSIVDEMHVFDDLYQACLKASMGELFIPNKMHDGILQNIFMRKNHRFDSLNKSYHQLLCLSAEGVNTEEMCRRMGIKKETLVVYRSKIRSIYNLAKSVKFDDFALQYVSNKK